MLCSSYVVSIVPFGKIENNRGLCYIESTMREKIYDSFFKITGVFGAGVCLLFSLTAFFFMSYSTDMTSQVVKYSPDRFWISIPLTVFLFLACVVKGRAFAAASGRTRNICLIGTLLWVLVAGLILLLFGRTIPAADSGSVYGMALGMAQGDYSVIGVNSYISFYPQQVGLMTYYEVLIRIWNCFGLSLAPFHFIKLINVVVVAGIVFFQYLLVGCLFGEYPEAQGICLFLSALNMPLIFYGSFVYGEIPSLFAFSLGIYMLAGCVRHIRKGEGGAPGFVKGLMAVLFLGCSVFLRKNMLIPVIALGILLLLEGLFHKEKKIRRKILLIFLFCIGVSFLIQPLSVKWMEHRTGYTINKGVTPLSYVAMGMQEASRAPGWYNGFNFDTYLEADFNEEKADEISRDAIRERQEYFGEHPGEAVRFYVKKILSQWADGTYAARQATLAEYGGRTTFFKEIYEGRYSMVLIELCNALQNLMYMGAAVLCFYMLRHRDGGMYGYMPVIALFGGFLFHTVWEANARYSFSYAQLMFLSAVVGLGVIVRYNGFGHKGSGREGAGAEGGRTC